MMNIILRSNLIHVRRTFSIFHQRLRKKMSNVDIEDTVTTAQIWLKTVNKSNLTKHQTQVHNAHANAIMKGGEFYVDPITNYYVMTMITHLDRGRCCGKECRHCPYNHDKSPKDDRTKVYNSAYYE